MTQTCAWESMGTHFKVTIWDTVSESVIINLKDELMSQSRLFDQTYSRFIPDSLVLKLSRSLGKQRVPTEFVQMLQLYRQLYEPSGKRLNPCIGFTLSDLGYDADYTLLPHATVRKTPDFFEAVSIVDEETIELHEPVLLDIGALGKGYFVDLMVQHLQSAGMEHFLVDGSGDVFYQGKTPLRVGLEDPADATRAIGLVEIQNEACCASATNRRAWGHVNHILDPCTGDSATEILASWVRAPRAAVADALATTFFLAAPEPFTDIGAFEFLLMNQQRKIKQSAGFSAELF